MQNLMVTLTSSILDRKYSFWANLVQKIKVVTLSWNLLLLLIWICRIQWWCSLFRCYSEIPFLGKFGPKNQNCHFKLKFGTYTNLNMQNFMARLTSSILDRKYRIWANFGPKNQSCHFKLKFGTFTNLNMRNSMMMVTFSVLYRKYCFWTNLDRKIKIATLSWNLVLTLMVRPTSSVLDQKYNFWANLVKIFKIVTLSWNLVLSLIWICRSSWRGSLLPF